MSFYIDENDNLKASSVVKTIFGVLVVLVGIWLMFALVGPQLRLYRVNTEKQAIITEAKAQAEAAQYTAEKNVEIAEAEADVDRARAAGIADSNTTIAQSLTPEYIQWYFIDRLDNVDGQIIYVPGEGLIPITEAGRAVQEETKNE